jgi:hypothetical protein
MHIGEILNGVYDDDIGWRPASGSIKPVHVANGLVRALQGKYFDLRELNHFIVWWRAGKIADDRRGYEALTREGAQAYGFVGQSPQEFEKTRRYALGLLGGDRALFPSAENSSFSLTCGQMATRDTNDRGLGEFAAFLLTGDGSEDSLANEIIRCANATKPSDPVTALVWPLLPTEAKESKRQGGRLTKIGKHKHNRDIFRAIQDAASSLATHERAQGNRLHSLQRAVHFTCVATHAHAQALAGGGELDARPPALVAIDGDRRSDVALASERSIDAIYAQFERWLGDRLAKRIAAGMALAPDAEPLAVTTTDGRTVRSILGKVGVAQQPHDAPEKDEVDTRYQTYATKLREFGASDPTLAMGHTLVHCYAREYSGGPRAFLQALGRKVGLLYPHFQGRAREKRVRPSVPVLDMLVRACVRQGDAVDLGEFLQRLWARFGLVVGGRRSETWDDAAYLERWGVAVDIDDLAANTDAFVDQLSLMGLARRYPDGVTFVGDGYGA